MQIAQFAKAVFNLSAISKTKKCLFRSTRWRIVPLSIYVVFANCTTCKSCFQFECNLQNEEEMSFQIYSLEDRTVINLCNLCKLHNFAKALFQFECNLQNEEMSFQIYTLEYRYQFCVICANCTIFKSGFQFECNLQKRRKWIFQIYSLEDRTLINLCISCKLHNLQKLFSIWVQFAKGRNVFSDLHIGVPLSICVICANCTIFKSGFSIWVQSA